MHHNESNSYQHQPITTTSGETALPDATDYVLIHLLYRELQNTEAAREPGRLFWYKLVKHIKRCYKIEKDKLINLKLSENL